MLQKHIDRGRKRDDDADDDELTCPELSPFGVHRPLVSPAQSSVPFTFSRLLTSSVAPLVAKIAPFNKVNTRAADNKNDTKPIQISRIHPNVRPSTSNVRPSTSNVCPSTSNVCPSTSNVRSSISPSTSTIVTPSTNSSLSHTKTSVRSGLASSKVRPTPNYVSRQLETDAEVLSANDDDNDSGGGPLPPSSPPPPPFMAPFSPPYAQTFSSASSPPPAFDAYSPLGSHATAPRSTLHSSFLRSSSLPSSSTSSAFDGDEVRDGVDIENDSCFTPSGTQTFDKTEQSVRATRKRKGVSVAAAASNLLALAESDTEENRVRVTRQEKQDEVVNEATIRDDDDGDDGVMFRKKARIVRDDDDAMFGKKARVKMRLPEAPKVHANLFKKDNRIVVTREKVFAKSTMKTLPHDARDIVARSTVARDIVARSTVARSTVARDIVARSTVARSTVARSTVARSTVARSTIGSLRTKTIANVLPPDVEEEGDENERQGTDAKEMIQPNKRTMSKAKKQKGGAVKPKETLVQLLQQKQKLQMEWEVTRVKRRTKRRTIDPVIRTLGCWASTRGIKLPAKCLHIPPIETGDIVLQTKTAGIRKRKRDHAATLDDTIRGTSDEEKDDDCGGCGDDGTRDGDFGDEDNVEKDTKEVNDGDREEEAEKEKENVEDETCDRKKKKEKTKRGSESKKVRSITVASNVSDTTISKAVVQMLGPKREGSKHRGLNAETFVDTLTIKDVGEGTIGGTTRSDSDENDVGGGGGTKDVREWKRGADELCIFSVDFGIVLTFAIILLSGASLRIVQWQSVRLSAGKVKCQEAALALATYLSDFLEGPPDFDVILLEEQPPKLATRTRDLSYTTYGTLQTMYRSVAPSHPRHATRKGMPHIMFVHPQLKINLCYLMSVESGKAQTLNYDHNKDISTVGCKHLLMHLAPHCNWATACLRWLLNQTKMDDYADALLQALAWYHNQPDHRLPFDIVPLNSFTTVAPPSAATVARRLKRPPDAPPPRPKVPLAVTLGKRNAKLKIKDPVGRLSLSDF
jgi:hypothetical protein